MTEHEHAAPERREISINPTGYLLLGERLIAEGNVDGADEALTQGITTLTSELLLEDIHDPADKADLTRLLASLHYTRADSFRVRAAAETDPARAATYYNLALADLDILQEFNRDNLTFVSPHVKPRDSVLLDNALIYLISRARGLLALHRAQTRQNDVEFTSRTLAIAYENLYTADEALASGIYREPPLAAPMLPVPTTANTEEEKAAAEAEYVRYKTEVQKINVKRRGQRRMADPDLATALYVTTTQLTRRNEQGLFDDEKGNEKTDKENNEAITPPTIPLPPDFSVHGPKVSDIFEIGP
jgi:hypothetical protein